MEVSVVMWKYVQRWGNGLDFLKAVCNHKIGARDCMWFSFAFMRAGILPVIGMISVYWIARRNSSKSFALNSITVTQKILFAIYMKK